MKKLNNKGFTLIELLAVIVILAIIMVVTIPTVLSSLGTARQNTFQTSANTVADWVEKEYSMAMIQSADKLFTDVCTPTSEYCKTEIKIGTLPNATDTPSGNGITDTTWVTLLKAAGVDPTNYSSASIQVTNGRACVKLGASQKKKSTDTSNTGQFANITSALAQSSAC